jgi:hypothetical protein
MITIYNGLTTQHNSADSLLVAIGMLGIAILIALQTSLRYATVIGGVHGWRFAACTSSA